MRALIKDNDGHERISTAADGKNLYSSYNLKYNFSEKWPWPETRTWVKWNPSIITHFTNSFAFFIIIVWQTFDWQKLQPQR